VLSGDANLSEEYWQGLLKEVDTDGDGSISYDEFRGMMMKLK
jgi:Ca2+-binding EF-hand superfamily protein